MGTSTKLAQALAKGAHDAFFRCVHENALIYNTCWEDPRLDREMLQIGSDSRVVTITSAGCNVLDYLLDNPAVIHAVDVNPRQNALLQLKVALLQHGDHDELFRVFGEGVRPRFRELLTALAAGLSHEARRFWQAKHNYFESSRLNPSFYYRGAAANAAWVMIQVLRRTNAQVRQYVDGLFEARSLAEQQSLYATVRPALWNAFNSWLVKQPVTMAMLGVPRPQIGLIENEFPGGIAGYVQSKVEYVLTRLPIADNYFWRVYAMGRYTRGCCPNYLRPELLSQLGERSTRVRTHSMTVSRFLASNPGIYTHYVLLDHQDWLASHDTEGLAEEWSLILRNSRPGTRILMRSASPEISFIPAVARERLRFFPDLTRRLHEQDRVGTYGSTLLAEVQ